MRFEMMAKASGEHLSCVRLDQFELQSISQSPIVSEMHKKLWWLKIDFDGTDCIKMNRIT